MKLLVTLKFIGTNYVGWQVQKNGVSVQARVQDAIEQICGERVDVTGCSRTDSGVHANGYRFCFTPPRALTPFRALAALNAALPQDMGATAVEEVPDGFHPRYNAAAKEYIYKMYGGRARDPFLEGFAWHCVKPLDAPLMDKAAQSFVGTHDFRSFMANGSKIEDAVRTVYYCRVIERDGHTELVVCADGFLYNMVRIIVGTLRSVSDGRIDKDSVPAIISAKDRNAAGRTAPPHGLYLNRVFYDIKEAENERDRL